MKSSFELFKDSNFWEKQWKDKADNYLKGKPVLGLFIERLINDNILSNVNSICEVAAGSSRDSLYLARKFSVTVTDKFVHGFKKAEKIGEDNKLNISFRQEDSFNFSFPDNYFDLVFHNGFFILFPDDNDILTLLYEQIRITKKYVLIVVHNKWDFYSRLRIQQHAKRGDALFDFRWWTLKKLKRIAKKFGKIVYSEGLEVRIIREIQSYKYVPKIIRKLKLWNWEGWKKILPCERIVLVIEIIH